jgi:hypothetical protein
MRSLCIVKDEVFRQNIQQFAHHCIAIDVHIFVLDTAPQTFNKDVIERPATTIHTDGDAITL